MNAGSIRKARSHRRQMLSAALAVCLSTAAAAAQPPLAPAAGPAEIAIADLERAFWACDYAATAGRVDAPTAAACGHFTELLKARKFRGDFGAMLDWWRANKPARHAALGATEQELVSRAGNDAR